MVTSDRSISPYCSSQSFFYRAKTVTASPYGVPRCCRATITLRGIRVVFVPAGI
jgi:hypothetical protein